MAVLSRKLISLVLLISLTFMLQSCGQSAAPTLIPVVVQLRWTHQAQFAGFYAADQNGYYSAEGLAVKFLEGGPTADFIEPVLNGTAQFSITNSDALLIARQLGQPVRAIAVILRTSPGVYITMASSGITRPQQFVGKIVQTGRAGIPRLQAMMTWVGVRPDQYTVMDSTSDLTSLYSGKVDVRSVNLTNEVITAKAAGYQINIIYPDDYGIHFYGDTLFTTDKLITTQPDLVLRFLRATLKGWTYAVENSNIVGALVLKYNPKADPALEITKMNASIVLINTGEDHIGWMRPEIWAGMEKTLLEQGVLSAPLDVTKVYTMQFLEEIYK